MGNTQELRFQGLCLVNSEGYRFMGHFDTMPELVKDRLRSSYYNLCALCVSDTAYEMCCGGIPTVPDYLKAISAMEQELKRQELVEAGWRIIT